MPRRGTERRGGTGVDAASDIQLKPRRRHPFFQLGLRIPLGIYAIGVAAYMAWYAARFHGEPDPWSLDVEGKVTQWYDARDPAAASLSAVSVLLPLLSLFLVVCREKKQKGHTYCVLSYWLRWLTISIPRP